MARGLHWQGGEKLGLGDEDVARIFVLFITYVSQAKRRQELWNEMGCG
jgi:hypothetical protein